MRCCVLLALSLAGCAHLHPDTTPPPISATRYGAVAHVELIESSSPDLNVHVDVPSFDSVPEPGRTTLNEAVHKRATDALADMQAVAAADVPDLRAHGFAGAYDLSGGYKVTFVNARYLCFDQWISTYTGGAHPNTKLYTTTVDLTDGAVVSLPDLFKNPTEALPRLRALVRTKLRGPDFFDEAASTWDATPATLFRFDPDGLVITFQQYEVAAYVVGFPEVTLPWSSLEVDGKRDLPPVQRDNE